MVWGQWGDFGDRGPFEVGANLATGSVRRCAGVGPLGRVHHGLSVGRARTALDANKRTALLLRLPRRVGFVDGLRAAPAAC